MNETDAPDLRSLRQLSVLVEEGSVSRAAVRLGLSQPGLSGALARLRRQTNDVLLVRTPSGMLPTPCALALVAELEHASSSIARVIAETSAFTPASSRRTFRIACADHAMQHDMADVVARVRAEAPGITLHVQPIVDHHFREHLERARSDLVLGYLPRLDDSLRVVRLRDVPLSVIVHADDPRFASGWNDAAFYSGEHIGLVIGSGDCSAWIESELDAAFVALGHRRRKVVFFPSHTAFPPVVARARLIGTVVTDIARAAARDFPIRAFDLPVAMPSCAFSLAWHDRCDADPAHRWLRALIREVAGGSRTPDRPIASG